MHGSYCKILERRVSTQTTSARQHANEKDVSQHIRHHHFAPRRIAPISLPYKQHEGIHQGREFAKKTRGIPYAFPRESEAITVPRSAKLVPHPFSIPRGRVGEAQRGSSSIHRDDGHARALIVGALVYPVAGTAGRSSSNSAQRYHGAGLRLLVYP